MAGVLARGTQPGMFGDLTVGTGPGPSAQSFYGPPPGMDGVTQGVQQTGAPDPAPATTTDSAPTGGGPLGGLAAAAPNNAATPGAAMTSEPDPNVHVTMSGPNSLRQGIGQRNPPNLAPVLTGLRSIY